MTGTFSAQGAVAPAFSHAYVRAPGLDFDHPTNHMHGIVDPARALYQHEAYCRALSACGVEVRALRHDPQFPNDCSIGGGAVITPSVAVIANFSAGHPHHGEQQVAASLLAGSRILKFITTPGLLDASDVVQIGTQFIVGLSAYTNQEGAGQLARVLSEFGYEVSIINLGADAPRLSHAVCDLGVNPATGLHRVLLREDLTRHYAFLTCEKIAVEYQDSAVLDCLMVNATLLLPFGYDAIKRLVAPTGIAVHEINVSEFHKMGAGLRSLSLRLPARARSESVVSLDELRRQRAA